MARVDTRWVGLWEQGARGAGGACDGRSEEQAAQDEDAQGEMAVAANAE